MENDTRIGMAVEYYQELREAGTDPLGAALKVREVYGTPLDVLYAELKACGLSV